MIIVHGTIPLRPDKREQALKVIDEMARATQSENGCITYEFYVALANPNQLMLFQEWESMESLMKHFQTEHMDQFLKELPDLVSGEITTRRYAVQSVDEDEELAEPPPPTIH